MNGKIQENIECLMRNYFDSMYLETRFVDGRKPDTSLTLYGEKFSTPIMAALYSGEDCIENHRGKMAKGSARAGAVNWEEMEEGEVLPELVLPGSKTIKMIKPYADNQVIFEKIACAERCGALAVGIDIGCAFDSNGEYACIGGWNMAPKSREEICEFVKASPLPFIVKGILSKRDAYKCLAAGAEGIVVSCHGSAAGSAFPPLAALPDIIKTVGGQIPVFLEGGIMSGTDAFKALAMGAAAVCAGRVFLNPLMEKGAEGVYETISRMNVQLKGAMAQTGCYSLDRMDSSVIRRCLF